MGRRKILPPDEAPSAGARQLRTMFLRMRRDAVAELAGVTEWSLSRYALGLRVPGPDERVLLERSLAIPAEAWTEPAVAPQPVTAVVGTRKRRRSA